MMRAPRLFLPARAVTLAVAMALPLLATAAAPVPLTHSGNPQFDALFTQATKEMQQASVSQIRDGSYNGGKAIACACFETGEQWHYVWTRDLSYAAALGLAALDPERVRNSLLFKLSGYRDGVKPGEHVAGTPDGLQIIQDTGSGGSWPVSTDRVSWAFGAEATLQSLPADQRAAFAATALKALSNTIENDRLAAWDRASGLYTGEESFLDWREQSYAAWIVHDLSSMATSKALSTNVGHYKALTLAAQLAREQGDAARADKYAAWAAALKQAINDKLWLADEGMYSSLTAGQFDGVAMHKFDWLGQALAIVTGVADQRQAQRILAHYPHGPMGAPVIYPQQPGVAVYHNRAIWPFVTAFGLRAAAMAGNSAVADAAYETLMRSAAQNGSNMENMEWLSGQARLEDGKLSGPVINSRRQLWSVGAYVGMVVEQVFGVSATDSGIALRPFVTAKLRRTVLAGSDVATLQQLSLRGKRLQVKLLLPAAAEGNGHYEVESITLNGQPAQASLPWSSLADDNTIEIRLGKLVADQQEIRKVTADPRVEDPAVYAPREPVIASVKRGAYGVPELHIAAGGHAAQAVTYNIYRDGQLAAERVSPGADGVTMWADRRTGFVAQSKGWATNSCYAVEAVYTSSGNRSHHSAPACVDPGREFAAAKDALPALTVALPGSYAVQIKYRNTANQINLGISGGVKWAALKDSHGAIVAEGVIQLPHTAADAGPGYSTPLTAQLKPGRYTITLQDFYNMSYLQSNTSFAGAGGTKGPSNSFELHGVRLMPLAPDTHGSLKIVDGIASPQLDNQRSLRIWLPPSYAREPERRYPVLYMHDGQNLFEESTTSYGTAWDVGQTADRLVANGEMQEVIIVGIDNNADRIPEYTPCCDPKYGGGKLDAYQAFIVDTVKPWADQHLRTLPGREHTAIMGSSLGGIASVYIAQHRPDVFSRAGGVSSSFWWNDQDMVHKAPTPRDKVMYYIDAGTDGDGLEDTIQMRDAMLAKGFKEGEDLYYYAAPGGVHNEKSWAARVDLPLKWFFPAKQKQ
jgi:predicted alpha/beta superfamily hydrolase